MLKKIYIDNFRCFVNFELRLLPLTLLMGLNGSGKSSVFDVLRRLRLFITGQAKVYELFFNPDLTKWQSRSDQTFNLEIEGNNGIYLYELIIEHNLDKRLKRVKKEKLSFDQKPLFDFQEGMAQLYRDDHSSGPQYPFDWSQSGIGSLHDRPDNSKITWFKNRVTKFIIANIQPAQLTGESAREEKELSYSASNFASWYRYLLQEYSERIFKLNLELGEILTGFGSFRLAEAGEEYRSLQAAFSNSTESRSYWYKFSELSDGQKILIVLYTLLFAIKGLDYSLFIDEPENFLALPEIQPWLMALEDTAGQEIPQAVLISHHPELIDYLGASSGVRLERETNGPVRIKDKTSVKETGLKLSENIARGWD